MTTQYFSSKQAYSFLKVEEYFQTYTEWDQLENVEDCSFDKGSRTLAIAARGTDGNTHYLLLQFPTADTVRVRFNPGKTAEQYDEANSRSIVQDTYSELIKFLDTLATFTINFSKKGDIATVKTDILTISLTLSKFAISITRVSECSEECTIWQTAETPLYFTKNGDDDYAVIQAVKKPATARYVGFGEQGGESLSKNGKQANYFNFDNMRYRQVYNRGPLDCREPLYHSDPFFLEMNGVPECNSTIGVYIDNTGQTLADIGFLNSSRYMFGTRFGDMDYFLFFGDSPQTVVNYFTALVGKSRLKPRYCLGYHQGCYGYERRDIVEWAAQKYREYQIPLDGIHVDVDIQHNYQTFTIDEGKFPNPQEMFTNLRNMGIKCSTNITPVISREDPNYQTFVQARDQDMLVIDKRHEPDNPDSREYQLYGGGNAYRPNDPNGIQGYNSAQPYIGGVYYGQDGDGRELGTSGHYPDLNRKEVRCWWGTQYQYLFNMGLEMVWQDMTTPAIREQYGDMKAFPFRLLVSNDSTCKNNEQTPAIKIWNLFSYNLHKATYHGLNNLEGRNNKRNFIIGRGCFTGSHRFAGLWTGDNSSDWDFLKMNISQTLSLGMCGLDINGQDIGGFEASLDGGKWASPELLIRWTAAGAFLPWFRNHYVRKGRKEFQEPFMYVQWFEQYRSGVLPEPQDLYRMVLPICKHYIELRYKLMQLFYDAMFSNTITGLPICRPLFLNDPQDKALYNDKIEFLDDQFFVGKDLLIAPVITPQSDDYNNGKRDVYLPAGYKWYSFVNNTMSLNEPVVGGTTIRDYDANLNLSENHINFIVPVYVREGAIIPTIELEQYVGQSHKEGRANPITLNIYPGECGEYTMYLDDGESRSSAPKVDQAFGGDPQAQSEYRQIAIQHSYNSDSKIREITVKRVHDGYTPQFEVFFYVAILHDPQDFKGATGPLTDIVIDGTTIQSITDGTAEDKSKQLANADTNAWYYNETINISFIKVMDASAEITIGAHYN